MTPSKAYERALADSKEIHKGKSFTGKFLRPHAPFVKEIIDRLGCKTVLDYGCGKGQQYDWVIPSLGVTIEQWLGADITRYDPAYPPFAHEPEGTFDLVICTQVLGSIPVQDRGWVIDRLSAFAKKAIYISERIQPPRKQIGDHAHRGLDWTVDDWIDALLLNIEVTLAIRTIEGDGQKITTHYRVNDEGDWDKVIWPPGIKAMSHLWKP